MCFVLNGCLKWSFIPWQVVSPWSGLLLGWSLKQVLGTTHEGNAEHTHTNLHFYSHKSTPSQPLKDHIKQTKSQKKRENRSIYLHCLWRCASAAVCDGTVESLLGFDCGGIQCKACCGFHAVMVIDSKRCVVDLVWRLVDDKIAQVVLDCCWHIFSTFSFRACVCNRQVGVTYTM